MAGRVIFHIDLNAFFASAEVLKNSALEGQPIAVASLNRRSVVCTASYEARSFGVSSAMPIHQALAKCPSLIIVQGNYEWYEQLSNKFFKYLKKFSPLIEVASIDECYMDVTDVIKKYKRPLDLAWMIQKSVLEELRLPCSIGVGPNKFLAKMASDMRKPLGITVLRRQEIQKKLWPLPIQEMYGIGKKTVPILKHNGIETIADFANEKNEAKIMQLLGKHAYSLIQNARGFGSNQLEYNSSIQSISQSTTLVKDIVDYDEIRAVFVKLAHKLATRAQADDISGALISISIRYFDFTNVVRSKSLSIYTNDENILLETALLLFDQHQSEKAIRHLGIGLASLFSNKHHIDQINLFDEGDALIQSTQEVLDQLNKQLNKNLLMKASDILKT